MKYMGSKAKLTSEILPIVLKDRKVGQWYVEPFAGGMNSICEVRDNRIANDIHYYLIKMWIALADGWIPSKITKEVYDDVRANQGKYPEYLVGWVGFNCSFSGKWFGGFAGLTNTKTGVLRDYQNEAINNVLKQTVKMEGVLFRNKEYYELELPQNCIIYCDPPYEGTTKYSNGFNHRFFWDWVRHISKQNYSVFVSEYNAPDDFECVFQKDVKSSLSANGKSGGSKTSTEKLFVYCG